MPTSARRMLEILASKAIADGWVENLELHEEGAELRAVVARADAAALVLTPEVVLMGGDLLFECRNVVAIHWMDTKLPERLAAVLSAVELGVLERLKEERGDCLLAELEHGTVELAGLGPAYLFVYQFLDWWARQRQA